MKPRTNDKKTILMEEGYWMNSPYSLARRYGGINANGGEYLIVDKHGFTLFELSDPTSKHYVGDGNRAIEAGEPADLLLSTFIPTYKKVGRDTFIRALQAGCNTKSAIEEFAKKGGAQ